MLESTKRQFNQFMPWLIGGILSGSGYALGAWQQQKSDEKIAAQDKLAAVDQMSGQIADNSTPIFTQGFADLARKNPWLIQTRGSVASYTVKMENGKKGFASAVLLDEQGTVVMSAHQFFPKSLAQITFYMADGYIAEINLHDFRVDTMHDIMFATLDQAHMERLKTKGAPLMPIAWGDEKKSADAIAVGFPYPSFRLFASAGKIGNFTADTTSLDIYAAISGGPKLKPMYCKYAADFVAFGGMSGGGVFSHGKFIGTLNTGVTEDMLGKDVRSQFTPVSLIRAAYAELYPDRAVKAGLNMTQQPPNLPSSCRVNRRMFFIGSSPS